MAQPTLSIYEDDPETGSPRLRPLTEDDLEQIQSEWKQILTHEPVFSTGDSGKRYIIRFDDVTQSVLQEYEADYVFEVVADNSETAIYDFLRQMGEEYWGVLDEDCSIWAIPEDENSGERIRLYEFRDESPAYAGKIDIEGVEVECWHNPCPNSGDDRLMQVLYADRRTSEPICFVCDLMPECIAKDHIRKALAGEGE